MSPLSSLKKRYILVAAGMLIPAMFFIIYYGCGSRIMFIPINCYCAIPNDGLVLPYPKEFNFGTNGIWLELPPHQTFPLREETAGLLWGPEGDQVPVQVMPEDEIVFVSLPTRPTKSNYNPGETLDLPIGLHHFSHLTVIVPSKGEQKYNIGDVWLEILPEEKIFKEDGHYYYRLLRRAGYNPAAAVFYQNTGSEPVTLVGIHLPSQFTYGLDKDYFWSEIKPIRDVDSRVIFGEADLQKLSPYLPLTERISTTQSLDFPQPVTVEPGNELTLCFALTAISPEAHRAFAAISPVMLRDINGHLVSNFSGSLARGLPHGFEEKDLFRKVLKR